MASSWPHRVVTYLSDEQVAAVRASLAREPHYGSISRMVCKIVSDGLAARGEIARPARRRPPARRGRRS